MPRTTSRPSYELPLPSFYKPDRVGEIYIPDYGAVAAAALAQKKAAGVKPAALDKFRIMVVSIDSQNTFCIPGFPLFVGGRSGTGAVDDTRRATEFMYRNAGVITDMSFTLDTHRGIAIFHPMWWVDEKGEHPAPFTQIGYAEVKAGKWRVAPGIAYAVFRDASKQTYLERYSIHYTKTLEEKGNYKLTIWPYHGIFGGVGHALVSALDEAAFYIESLRGSARELQVKGGNPLTENYSVFMPEVLVDHLGNAIGAKNTKFIELLLAYDAIVFKGQAASHCVAWSVVHFINEIIAQNPELAKKIYLLRDCTSPVVVPGVIDYTDQAEAAFAKCAAAGMNVVDSTTPISEWPGMAGKLAA